MVVSTKFRKWVGHEVHVSFGFWSSGVSGILTEINDKGIYVDNAFIPFDSFHKIVDLGEPEPSILWEDMTLFQKGIGVCFSGGMMLIVMYIVTNSLAVLR